MVQVADPFGSGSSGGGSLGLQLALDSGDQWLVDLHTPVAEGTPGYATPILDEPLLIRAQSTKQQNLPFSILQVGRVGQPPRS